MSSCLVQEQAQEQGCHYYWGGGPSPGQETEEWCARYCQQGKRLVCICCRDESQGQWTQCGCNDFASSMGESEDESDIGTKGVPEDVCKKHEESSEHIKDESEKEDCDHTNIQYL